MSRDQHHPDDALRRLLADAVDDVEPADGLATIRSRTHEKVTPMTDRRPWLYAVTGAVVATAAVITAVALAGGTLTAGDGTTPAAGDPTPTVVEETSDAPSPDPTAGTDPPGGGGTVVVPAYYLGEGPRGPVLFREFHTVPGASDTAALGAAREAVGGAPRDPDYRSAWPSGVTVESVAVDGDLVRVDLSQAPARGDLSEREAELALQQLVHSVQGALQQRLPVRLTVDGRPVAEVLGVTTAEPLTAAPTLETLSHMSITAPEEGARVPARFTAEGVSNGFEANVLWQVTDADGTVVAEGFGTAEGWMEERLFPWSVQVDLSGMAPGEYTFLARTEDPSGGAEGGGPASDDRTIVVE